VKINSVFCATKSSNPFRLDHSKQQKTIFECSECKFNTNTKSNLRSHMLTHKQTALLKCNICGDFKCKRQSELKRHCKVKHGRSESEVWYYYDAKLDWDWILKTFSRCWIVISATTKHFRNSIFIAIETASIMVK